jgi:hypothetical protein
MIGEVCSTKVKTSLYRLLVSSQKFLMNSALLWMLLQMYNFLEDDYDTNLSLVHFTNTIFNRSIHPAMRNHICKLCAAILSFTNFEIKMQHLIKNP